MPTPDWLQGAPVETSLAIDGRLYSKYGVVEVGVEPSAVGIGLVVSRELDDRIGFIDDEGRRYQLRELDGTWVYGELSAVQRYADPERMALRDVQLVAGEQQVWIRPRRVFADFAEERWVGELWQEQGASLSGIDQVALGWDGEHVEVWATCPRACTEADARALRRLVAGLRASVGIPEAWRPPLRSLRLGLVAGGIAGTSR